MNAINGLPIKNIKQHWPIDSTAKLALDDLEYVMNKTISENSERQQKQQQQQEISLQKAIRSLQKNADSYQIAGLTHISSLLA